MTRNPIIVSSIPGRLRLRHPDLKNAQQSADFLAGLRAVEGVSAVEGSPRTGSVLVHYDVARCPKPQIEGYVTTAFATEDAPLRAPVRSTARERRNTLLRTSNRLARFGMLASFPASLALAAAGSKKLHAVTGGVFTLLLLIHLAAHRRHLLK